MSKKSVIFIVRVGWMEEICTPFFTGFSFWSSVEYPNSSTIITSTNFYTETSKSKDDIMRESRRINLKESRKKDERRYDENSDDSDDNHNLFVTTENINNISRRARIKTLGRVDLSHFFSFSFRIIFKFPTIKCNDR